MAATQTDEIFCFEPMGHFAGLPDRLVN